MMHFTSEVLERLFTPIEVVDIIRKGILNYAIGKYNIPNRQHIVRVKSTNLIMPAFSDQYYCIKLISVDPLNHLKDLPIISGILVLNDTNTGETLMTMDAPMITALRTAAIGSIGCNLISKKDDTILGIIGLGVQGLWQTIFIASTKNITEIYCFSRNEKKFTSYKSLVSKKFPALKITWCSSSEDVVFNAHIIVSCTTANKPVFDASKLNISTKKFISIGSFTKDMQEFPEEIYRQSDALIIDSKSAIEEVGDVINIIKHNWIEKSNIITLTDVISGKKLISNFDKIVFKSVGMAAFDLALSVAVYEKVVLHKN
jgi:ornithine cyclodeaminase/alanine dehydrogenase-like protein (mu-crystallin family)